MAVEEVVIDLKKREIKRGNKNQKIVHIIRRTG